MKPETRKRRFAAVALASFTLASVNLHKASVRKALAVVDANAVNLANTINTQTELQVESLVREKAILEADFKIMEETVVNRYKHRGITSIATAIRRKTDAIEDYQLRLTNLQESTRLAQVTLTDKYRNRIEQQYNATVIRDSLEGSIYVALVKVGKLASGYQAPECVDDICLVPGEWLHYRKTGDIARANGPTLNTLTCGVFIDIRIGQYDLGRIESLTTVSDVSALLTSLKIRHFYVTKATCAPQSIKMENPRITDMLDETRRLLGADTITDVRGGFRIPCTNNTSNGNTSAAIQSYLCTVTHKKTSIDSVIALTKTLKVVANSALSAFDEQQIGVLSLLGQMGADTVNGLVDFGSNFAKFKNLMDNGDLDTANQKITIAIVLGGFGLATGLLANVVFFVLYSRLKKQQLKLSNQGPDVL